jgi:type II secretory pathway pseudopilin PulG
MKLTDLRTWMRPEGVCGNQFSEGRVTRVPELIHGLRERLGTRVTRPSEAAFTMVEIAISLAVIGFALVAIIGVLPLGINVQKENREETIICQDASVFLSAIRSGARGMDDLTNYVVVITNYVWQFNVTPVATNGPNPPEVRWYKFADSYAGAQLRLTNGARIIGLLSTPRYVPTVNGFRSNYVVSYFRALSGSAFEKVPQANPDILNLSFAYRLIPELTPLPTLETNSIYTRTYETNLHELRLAFRWPRLPNDLLGNGRQIFRTLAGGRFEQATNGPFTNLYFLQPSTFATAQ